MGLFRIILALSVVIEHSSSIFGIELVGGRIAVQAFYIISGFYMTLILKEKYVGVNSSYKLFISNRLIRLFPIYWTVLLLSVGGSFLDYAYSSGSSFGYITPFIRHFESMSFFSFAILLISNLFIIFQDWIMFLGIDISSGSLFFTTDFNNTNPVLASFLVIPQAWTLGLEITFYLIAPFIVRRKLALIIGLIFISLFVRLFLISNGLNHDPWTYRFFPSELMFFLLGTISYSIYKKIEGNVFNKKILLLILLAVILFTFTYGWITFKYKYIAYLGCVFLSIPFMFKFSKNNHFDRLVGELSYPIYISHWLILGGVTYLGFSENLAYGFIVSLTSIVFSIILNKFVSNKIELIRQNRLK